MARGWPAECAEDSSMARGMCRMYFKTIETSTAKRSTQGEQNKHSAQSKSTDASADVHKIDSGMRAEARFSLHKEWIASRWFCRHGPKVWLGLGDVAAGSNRGVEVA